MPTGAQARALAGQVARSGSFAQGAFGRIRFLFAPSSAGRAHPRPWLAERSAARGRGLSRAKWPAPGVSSRGDERIRLLNLPRALGGHIHALGSPSFVLRQAQDEEARDEAVGGPRSRALAGEAALSGRLTHAASRCLIPVNKDSQTYPFATR